jgi:hypothetical protein
LNAKVLRERQRIRQSLEELRPSTKLREWLRQCLLAADAADGKGQSTATISIWEPGNAQTDELKKLLIIREFHVNACHLIISPAGTKLYIQFSW